MNAKTLIVSGVVLAATSVIAQEKATPPAFVSEVTVNNVTVDVKVVDAQGVPVTTLKKPDFRIFEDGKEQALTNFLVVTGGQVTESPDASVVGQAEPRQIVLFFDLYELVESDKKAVLQSIRDQVASGLPPAETMAVVSYDGTLRVHTPPTASVAKLVEALKEVDRLPATGLQRQIKLSTFRTDDLRTGRSYGGYEYRHTQNEEYWNEMRRIVGSVQSAFAAALDRFALAPGARKVVVLVSPGFPRAENVPIYRTYDFFRDTPASEYRNVGLLERAAQLASELEYTLYAVDPSGLSNLDVDASRSRPIGFTDVANVKFWREADRKDNLIQAARLTGGEAVFTADGGAALADVERLTASFYSLAFQPDHAGDGKEHKLKVEVNGHPEYKLTFRQSYVDRPAEQREAERTRAALLTGQTENPLGLELVLDKPSGKFRFGAAGMKVYKIGAELRIPYAHLTMLPRGPVAWGQVQVVIVVTDGKGNLSDLAHRRVPIEVPAEKLDEARQRGYFAYRMTLEMEGGKQSMRIGVDDVLAHTTSAIVADLDL
ncbi:MAG TPA: VWA domain-containing protein [Thermoanaerobaculaceae bacterium]|nr:VWA domain-containing protein [Thermoanaerobaculaceae bacterium]